VVHHDGRNTGLELGARANDPRLYVRESRARRDLGSWSLAADVLEAIAVAEAEADPDWIALLSGQDYPTRSLTDFGAELAASGYDAFVSARPVPESRPAATDTPGLYAWVRYHFTWRRLPDWVLGCLGDGQTRSRAASVVRRLSLAQRLIFIWSLPAGGGDLVGVRRRTTPFGPGLRCYMGSQWLTMSRGAAAKVREFVAERPDVVDLYRTSVLADESLILTILLNDPSLRVSLENHHHLRMTGPGEARAAVLTVADLPAIEGSGRPLTRKLDLTAEPELFDRLDARIQGGLASD
jgi:hypothetical protein